MLSGVGRARGPPLPFAFYPAWQQQVTKNDREAKSRNRAKYGQSELASPERILWPKQPPHQGEQPHPLPRSGSVQLGGYSARRGCGSVARWPRLARRHRPALLYDLRGGIVTDEVKDDVVLASAARFLIDGGEEDAASVLLSCSLEFWPSGDTWYDGDEALEA